VYPQRLVYIGRRFGTLYRVHLQRLQANINQTLGIHPKIETVNTEHSESLKSRIISLWFMFLYFFNRWYCIDIVPAGNHDTKISQKEGSCINNTTAPPSNV
jgi:hypothetical protein